MGEDAIVPDDVFECAFCGKELTATTADEDSDWVHFSWDNGRMTSYSLCRSCMITAVHAFQFAKEITLDCQSKKGAGKRIYVAVEKVQCGEGQSSELVNVLLWPDHPLKESV